MINILPTITIIKWICVVYALLVALTVAFMSWVFGEKIEFGTIAAYSFSGATALQFALIAIFSFGWRKLWTRVPKLNDWIYPDLNGTWEMDIFPSGREIPIKATAHLSHDLMRISMNVMAPDSSSLTLAAMAKKDSESGKPKLYYFFLVTTNPKPDKPSKVYRGAAALDIDLHHPDEIVGNYWTSEESGGHYKLRRG